MLCPHHSYAGHRQQDSHGAVEGQETKKGHCNPEKGCCDYTPHPVYLYSGEHFYLHTDMVLKGAIPITIQRHYSSFTLYNAEFGYGWILNYSYKLYRQHDGNLLLRRGCYSNDIFTDNEDGTFTEAEKGFETITENQNGTYTLNRKDNWKYQFDINGCLSSIDDTNGNQLMFTYSEEKLPVSGISPYSTITTPIVVGYSYRLLKIEQYVGESATGRYVEFTYNNDGRITQVEDSFGREVLYGYDESENGDLVSYTDAESNAFTYEYEDHLLTEYTDAGCSSCGTVITEYDAVTKRVTSQTHGLNVQEFSYPTPGETGQVLNKVYNESTQTLLREYTQIYVFDANKNVLTETTQYNPGSGTEEITWTYTYNNKEQVLTKTAPNGTVTTNTYDTDGNLLTSETETTDEETVTTTNTYDSRGNRLSEEITSSFDANTYRTEYVYEQDTDNLLQRKRIVDENTEYTTVYTYNSAGQIATVTDPRENTIQYTYTDGFVTREYDPDNTDHETNYTYDDFGNRLTVTDANDNTTTFEYDDLNRVISITNPNAEETVYTYNGLKLVQVELGKTVSLEGHIIQFEYNSYNRQTVVKMKTGSSTYLTLKTVTYDSEGNILTKTDANSITYSYAYDKIGRVLSVTDDISNVTSFEYDDMNNMTKKTDAEGNYESYVYDGFGNLMSSSQEINNTPLTTAYTYNALGQVLNITDAESHTTAHSYDVLGRLVEVEKPLTQTETYEYDENNNLIRKTDAEERITEYDYNAYNAIEHVYYGGEQNPVKTVTFGYDDADSLTSWNDGTYSAAYTYDELNRVESVATTYPSFSKTVTYTYDRFGNRATLGYPNSIESLTYAYNALNRLTSITAQGPLETTYAYDNGGRLTTKTLPNGSYTTYAYDDGNRLTSLINKKADNSTISSFAYTLYDDVGNRKTMVDADGTHSYTYDDIYRLTGADHPTTPPDETYTYDDVGNRLTSTDDNDWAYDNNNRLTGYDDIAFTYDDNGNMTVKDDDGTETDYTYDYENRLTAASRQGMSAAYTYDPFGRRLSKTVSSTTVYYLYDNEDIIAEYSSNGTLQAKYVHGLGIDQPIFMNRNSTNYYYLFDGLGSVKQLINASEVVQESYKYDAFGKILMFDDGGDPITQSAIGNNYTYTSREYDVETGMYFYRARYYDSKAGRFITEDPIGFDAAVNFYGYVGNNPVRYIDPFGKEVQQPIEIFKKKKTVTDWRTVGKKRITPWVRDYSYLCDIVCSAWFKYINREGYFLRPEMPFTFETGKRKDPTTYTGVLQLFPSIVRSYGPKPDDFIADVYPIHEELRGFEFQEKYTFNNLTDCPDGDEGPNFYFKENIDEPYVEKRW